LCLEAFSGELLETADSTTITDLGCSGPTLPPVTRVEEQTSNAEPRRLARIRRLLKETFSGAIPFIADECATLQPLLDLDDLEKWYDVSEITDPEIQEAESGAKVGEFDEQESVRALGVMQWRFAILRRMLLCHLLSVPADGTIGDLKSWGVVLRVTESISTLCAASTEKINHLLKDDDQVLAVQLTPSQRNTPERERVKQQLRKINEYSGAIRTMQARLLALREDAVQILDGQGNANSLQPLLTAQAEALNLDLRMLNLTHESWRASLNPDRSDRRVSWTSSGGLRSPSSLGGLTVVDELGTAGSPADALLALNGERSDAVGSPVMASDEEIFEGMAVPKQRARMSMTREEKIAKLMEDEARRATAREARMQHDSMMRELETVMTSKSRKRMSTPARIGPVGRISSL
jgi:hypothetical protein